MMFSTGMACHMGLACYGRESLKMGSQSPCSSDTRLRNFNSKPNTQLQVLARITAAQRQAGRSCGAVCLCQGPDPDFPFRKRVCVRSSGAWSIPKQGYTRPSQYGTKEDPTTHPLSVAFFLVPCYCSEGGPKPGAPGLGAQHPPSSVVLQSQQLEHMCLHYVCVCICMCLFIHMYV